MNLTNNIIYQTPSEAYYVVTYANTGTQQIFGTNNLFYGIGPSPTGLTNSLNVDPTFVSKEAYNFHLLPVSPVIYMGAASPSPATDLDGILRPSPPSLGAYDFVHSLNSSSQSY